MPSRPLTPEEFRRVQDLFRKVDGMEKMMKEYWDIMDQIRDRQHLARKEMKEIGSRIAALEYGMELMNRAQKAGIEPEELFEEALRILPRSREGEQFRRWYKIGLF